MNEQSEKHFPSFSWSIPSYLSLVVFSFLTGYSPLESSIRPFIRLSANITNFTFSYVFWPGRKGEGLSVFPDWYWWEIRRRNFLEFRISPTTPSPKFKSFLELLVRALFSPRCDKNIWDYFFLYWEGKIKNKKGFESKVDYYRVLLFCEK